MKKSITTHLKERHLDIKKYPSLHISEEYGKAYFYLYNLSGMIVGYQCYTPSLPKRMNKAEDCDRRYHTYITKSAGMIMLTAFGLDILDTTKKEIFLVEGIFDACRLHNLGLNALALLCSDVSFLKEHLMSMGYKLIPVCEGDEAGLKLATLATHKEIIYLEEGYDLGDLDDKYIECIFKDYI